MPSYARAPLGKISEGFTTDDSDLHDTSVVNSNAGAKSIAGRQISSSTEEAPPLQFEFGLPSMPWMNLAIPKQL